MSDDRKAILSPWRVGRKVGRTIYVQFGPEPADTDELISVMDSPALAKVSVQAHNDWLKVISAWLRNNWRLG